MSSMKKPVSGKAFWRSLEDYAEAPEFMRWAKAEFPALLEPMSPPSRRSFLRLMGASAALAGLAACRWPKETILPFSQRPEDLVPGVPQRFATAFDYGGHAQGLLVTSYDGRPIKIEGNPEHPLSRGASNSFAQASVLSLYDPDRSRVPYSGGKKSSWADFDAAFGAQTTALAASGGAGFAVLAEASSSPSRARLQAEIESAWPNARWFEYEAISRDNEREGTRLAFGKPLRPQYDFSKAELAVCLDADLLGEHPASLAHARGFAVSRRRIDEGRLGRLYAIESCYSITGAAADERFPMPSGRIPALLVAIAQGLEAAGVALPSGVLRAAVSAFPPGESLPLVATIIEDLLRHRGHGFVAVGAQHLAEAHALAFAINDALANTGHTVSYLPCPDPERVSHSTAIASLARKIEAGELTTLLVLGANPVYNAPADFDFGALLAKVGQTIHLGQYRDETAEKCLWHLPEAHYLESWGDARSWDGSVSVVQPLIEPLHGSRSALEILAGVLGRQPADGHGIVRETITGLAGDKGDKAWRRTLHDGLLAGSAPAPVHPRIDGSSVAASLASAKPKAAGDLELVFTTAPDVYDGRFANNAWLQETPDPLTKLTWDNALLVGPATADKLGVRHGELAKVEAGGRSIEAPVFIAPGQALGSIALGLGYGRTAAGRVGSGVGISAYPLRTLADAGWSSGITVTGTGQVFKLATTQDHFAIDVGGREETERRRPELVREANLEEFKRVPDFVRHRSHDIELFSLWEEFTYEGHSWGMSIDLNTCIGCNYCAVACQAENNVPVVGKEQVYNGREMAWLRVDRYYGGDPEDASIAFQPLACQQCEMAPCEEVCPASATVHDDEGLNTMVYNRCIGTRYCSNNCPYKVRRFNFFNYHKNLTELESLGMNPGVSVRSRGVMEKCTYCTQRIAQVKILAKNEGRPIEDGEITPACAQACPTQAITFGDLNDEKSRVRELHQDKRAYSLLGELNIKPRTKYLGRIKNPSSTGHTEHSSEEHH